MQEFSGLFEPFLLFAQLNAGSYELMLTNRLLRGLKKAFVRCLRLWERRISYDDLIRGLQSLVLIKLSILA
jgi:hypothetical protein